MKALIIFCSILIVCSTLFSKDKPKDLYPQLGQIPDLSEKTQKEYALRDSIQIRVWKGYEYEKLKEWEKQLLAKYEMCGGFYDILPATCSWYCAGGPYKVVASSELESYYEISYCGENAHDLSFETAWIEGVSGYGTGEYLEYYFKNDSPRITDILIYNGYLKTDKAWRENAKVKKLNFFINDTLYAVLHLEDTKARQVFPVDTLGRNSDGTELVLKFEIADIYPGEKYDDTAITELYFDGLDVHCLAAGTMITMSDNKSKAIEDINAGDKILTLDIINQQLDSSQVLQIDSIDHCEMIYYKFSNGTKLLATPDHPILLYDFKWSSFDPIESRKYSGYNNIRKLKIGDSFFHIANNSKIEQIELIEIEHIHRLQKTYTITKLNNFETFIANGLLVGVETLNNPSLR